MSIYSWSTSAASNASADANIDWAEGMLPSGVNDSARAMMAALAAMVRDQGGYATSAGSSNAFTLALSQTMTSKVPALIAFRADRANTGAATMNVDSSGAYPLRRATGVDLGSGDIVSGGYYIISWDATNSEWKIANQAGLLPLSGGTVSGALTLQNGLTVTSGGAAITGNSTVTGTLTATTSVSTPSLTTTTSVSTDTIVERTSAAGVTIDGVLLKDSLIGGVYRPITASTAQSASGASSVDFTSIPSWVKRITFCVSGLSVGTNDRELFIRIGNSGSSPIFAITGYKSVTNTFSTAPSIVYDEAGIGVTIMDTSSSVSGTFSLVNVTGNVWVASGVIGDAGSSEYVSLFGGNKTLSNTLDCVQLVLSGGTFNGGSVNIFYE